MKTLKILIAGILALSSINPALARGSRMGHVSYSVHSSSRFHTRFTLGNPNYSRSNWKYGENLGRTRPYFHSPYNFK